MNNDNSESCLSRANENLTDVVGVYAIQDVLAADGSPEKDYKRFILGQTCVTCGAPGGKAHQIELSGWWCVPGYERSQVYLVSLCNRHDLELTNADDKNLWWSKRMLSGIEEACHLWTAYHIAAQAWGWQEEAKEKRAAKKL